MQHDLEIFTTNIEPEAVNQIYTLITQPPFCDSKIRIMPDVHYGTGCVVGFTATLTDKIIPNVLGVDLGCGMLTVELGKIDIDLAALDALIRTKIPSGSAYRREVLADKLIKSLHCYPLLTDHDRLFGSLGTLGGGNHFIELDADTDGNKYLVIHSGSRNLGKQVAHIYQKRAIDACKNAAAAERERVTAELNKKGRPDEIPDAMERITEQYRHKTKIPSDLCYLEGKDMQDYLDDVRTSQQFAMLNRKKMADVITSYLRVRNIKSFETVHNFIDSDNVIRKGAIPAHAGQRVLIPMNMRDGCIIATGKGNPEWNCSAPHGAGRLCKRSEAKELFTLEEYRQEMQGIYSSTVCESTLDESPMVYKPMQEIVSLIEPTVTVERIIKPIYNFKSAD